MILATALVSGDFRPRKFFFKKNEILYSYLEGFCHTHTADIWNCDYLIDYLTETGALKKCDGKSYVCYLFSGIGEAAA